MGKDSRAIFCALSFPIFRFSITLPVIELSVPRALEFIWFWPHLKTGKDRGEKIELVSFFSLKMIKRKEALVKSCRAGLAQREKELSLIARSVSNEASV